MQYTLTINQPKAVELGLNINEAHILGLLSVSPTWAEPIVIENEVYYWVARQKICKELAILKLKEDTVYRHLKNLDNKGLIFYKKQGKKDCIKLTEMGKSCYVGNKSEFDKNSEINPKELGNKSEKNSEINPTYYNTNINHNTNNYNKKNTKKKNFDFFISLLQDLFKQNKISTFKSKINKNPSREPFKQLDTNNLELIAEQYTAYVAENKNYAVRLDKWLFAYLEGNLDALNRNGSSKSNYSDVEEYFRWKDSLFGQDDTIDTEVIGA